MTLSVLEPKPVQAAHLAGKYLTFVIDRESYGISVLKIREIIRVPDITPVPEMPRHFKGVINLRGRIIPVLDPRIRFGLCETPLGDRSCIIVVQVTLPSQRTTPAGLTVDAVEEVVQIAADDIEEPPQFSSGPKQSNIIGVAKLKSGLKALLDIDRLVMTEQLKFPSD